MSRSYNKRERKRRKKWWEHHPDAQPGDGPSLPPIPPLTKAEFEQVVTSIEQREFWRRQKADPPIQQGSSVSVIALDSYRESMEELQARLEHLYAPPQRRWDLPWLADNLPRFNPGAPALVPALQAIQDLFELVSVTHDWWEDSTVLM